MADPISAAIMTFAASVGGAASTVAGAIGFSAATATAIGAAVGSFTMGALSLGTMGGGIAAALGGLAITAGISALSAPKVPDQSAQLNLKRSSVADRTMLAGRVAVGGILATDSMVHGYKNRLVSYVCIFSGAGQSGVVEKIIYGDDEITFDANGNAIGTYANKIWLTQRNGSFSQTAAIQTWSGQSYDQPSDWGSNDKLLGCAHALVTINAGDDKIKADGIKNPIFVFNANQTPLIDPRTGSAATTQEQYENPFVWAYSWARSLFQATPSGLIIAGLALASAGVHTASFADAANYAYTNGFKISAEINLNPQNAWENLRAITQAGGGDVTTRAGQLYCTTASPKSIVGIITDDDCTSKPTRKALNPAHDRPNRIIPRFRSEANKWEIIDGTPITSTSFVTEDGGKVRTASEYMLPFAGGGATPIGKLAALALVNAREPWQYSLSLKPQARYLGYVGDCVQLDITRLGWTGKKVLIGELSATIGLATSITAVSETDSKYSWALGQSTTPPNYYANSRFDARSVPQPDTGKWTTSAAQITSGSTSIPIIRISGDALDYPDCTGIVFEYKPNSGSTWQMAGDLPRTATDLEINEVTPNTVYNIRVSYKGKGGFLGTPRTLSNVTTGTFVAGEAAAGVGGAPILNSQVATGQNQLVNSNFTRGTYGWQSSIGGNPLLNLAGWFGQRNVIYAHYSPVLASGSYIDFIHTKGTWGGIGSLADMKNFAVPVKTGDTVFFGAKIAYHQLSSATIYLILVDKDGNYVNAYGYSGGRAGGAAGGLLSNFDFVGGIATEIPNSGIAYAYLMIRGFGSGVADSYIFMTEPQICKIPTGQTAFPPYTDGRNDPLADVTLANVAAAITGQGALATLNNVGTLQISANAVSTIQDTGYFTPTVGTANTWVQVGSKSITSTGQPVRVDFAIFAQVTATATPSAHHIAMRIKRNGTILFDRTIVEATPLGPDGGGNYYPLTLTNGFSFLLNDAVSAGTNTYTMELYYTSLSYCVTDTASIILTELKR